MKNITPKYTVTQSEWDAIDDDYKGKWQAYFGDHPEWFGRRVVMSTCITHNATEKCSLLIEDIDFIIVK